MKVKGADALIAQLKRNANLDDVKRVVKMNGADLERRMKRNARFKGHYDSKGNFVKPTGDTKRSIELSVEGDGFNAIVGPKTHYSPYLEHGTRFMSAQSFVKPSFAAQEKIFIKDMRRLMR